MPITDHSPPPPIFTDPLNEQVKGVQNVVNEYIAALLRCPKAVHDCAVCKAPERAECDARGKMFDAIGG